MTNVYLACYIISIAPIVHLNEKERKSSLIEDT